MWETSLGMFRAFRASFEGLPQDQLPLCMMLLKNTMLTFTAFSFPASLSLLAVERPLSGQAFQEAAVLFLISNIS